MGGKKKKRISFGRRRLRRRRPSLHPPEIAPASKNSLYGRASSSRESSNSTAAAATRALSLRWKKEEHKSDVPSNERTKDRQTDLVLAMPREGHNVFAHVGMMMEGGGKRKRKNTKRKSHSISLYCTTHCIQRLCSNFLDTPSSLMARVHYTAHAAKLFVCLLFVLAGGGWVV